MLERRLRALDLRKVRTTKGGVDGDRLEVTFDPVPQGLWSAVQFAWAFALVHYIFYGLVATIVAYCLRDILAVRVVTAIAVLAYLPSFFDGSELKLGRPWDR